MQLSNQKHKANEVASESFEGGENFILSIRNILKEQEVVSFSLSERPVLSKSLTTHLDIEAYNRT